MDFGFGIRIFMSSFVPGLATFLVGSVISHFCVSGPQPTLLTMAVCWDKVK